MNLGDRIRGLRDTLGLTQGRLANSASLSQGYLSQLEKGDVKNPSAAVLLRIARATDVDPDELFEAAGYPTVRTLRQIYRSYESTIEPDLLSYLGRLPRDRQRRLFHLLEGLQSLLQGTDRDGDIDGFRRGGDEPMAGPRSEERHPHLEPLPVSKK